MNSGEPYAVDGAKRKRRRDEFFGFVTSNADFEAILSKIIKSESGIKKAILVDRTGLTITSVSKFSYFPADVDDIGAVSSAVFCASEEQGKNLDLGDLDIVTSEFSGGKIFASGFGSIGVIALISDPDINIGLIRLILKRLGDPEGKVICQYCGRKLTKDEQFTHSCNRFYLG